MLWGFKFKRADSASLVQLKGRYSKIPGLLRVGLIGCGKIAEIAHLPAYQMVRRASVVAIADTDVSRASRLAEKFGVPKYYSDPSEILESRDVQAVDICLPSFLHSEFIQAACSHGKHVFCEKPMGTSVREADEALVAVRNAGKILMVGYNQRFQPAFARIKGMIESSVLGEVLAIEVEYVKRGVQGREGNWRASRSKGGGAILDTSCHKIDLLRWFCGEPSEVDAKTSFHDKEQGAEDTAITTLRFKSGALGVITAALNCALPVSEMDSLKVLGSKGTVYWSSDQKDSLHLYLSGKLLGRTLGFANLETKSNKDAYVSELDAFVDSVSKGEPPPITGEDAREVLKVIEAAHRSADEHRTMQLE